MSVAAPVTDHKWIHERIQQSEAIANKPQRQTAHGFQRAIFFVMALKFDPVSIQCSTIVETAVDNFDFPLMKNTDRKNRTTCEGSKKGISGKFYL